MAALTNFELDHELETDVLYVNVHRASPRATIDVIDIGEQIGFPGLVVARVDRDRDILYGLTIQDYAAFKKKLLRKYNTNSTRRALQLLLDPLVAGFNLEQLRAQAASV
jgi:hypothetical protein